jgi:hypothetical protein
MNFQHLSLLAIMSVMIFTGISLVREIKDSATL